MDLQSMIYQAVDRLLASGEVEKAIDKQLSETVQRTVKDALGSYSDFGKQLEAAVKKSLGLHGDLDLPSYNDTLLKIVRAQVEAGTHNTIQRQVADRLKDLLEPAPETIGLSKLIEAYRERLTEERDAGCVCYGD